VPSYRIRLTLRGEDPPVRRRIMIPGQLPLRELTRALTVSMGWSGERKASLLTGAGTSADAKGGFQTADDYLKAGEGLTFSYGKWTHDIKVEGIYEDYPHPHAMLVKMQGDCPAERTNKSLDALFCNMMCRTDSPEISAALGVFLGIRIPVSIEAVNEALRRAPRKTAPPPGLEGAAQVLFRHLIENRVQAHNLRTCLNGFDNDSLVSTCLFLGSQPQKRRAETVDEIYRTIMKTPVFPALLSEFSSDQLGLVDRIMRAPNVEFIDDGRSFSYAAALRLLRSFAVTAYLAGSRIGIIPLYEMKKQYEECCGPPGA